MGFLRKIFKPVSKVLDKIVPNEIKPALPYLAAFAPFLAPGIMGSSVLQRAAMGGGLNIFGQLSQEGNEGDINLLSAGLGALSGAMSAPGTQAAPIGDGAQFVDTGAEAFKYSAAGQPSGAQFFKGLSDSAEGTGVLASGQRFLGDTLAKGSNIMSEGIAKGLFTKEGAKAAILPGMTATGDLMFAQAKRDQDEYDRMMEEESENEYASDASRAFAIRQSMESYGFTEQEILDAISAAGYKTGGRVGLEFGGITDAVESVEETPKEFLVDKLKVTVQPGQSEEMGILNAIFNDTDGVMSDDRKMEFYKLYIPQLYKRGEISKEVYEGMKEDIFGEGKAEGGLMNLGGKEMDLRGGGFVPIGKKEKADDVPARLSKNEFVMTADAVRAAGGGSVNEGAKRMYETMNRLEAKV